MTSIVQISARNIIKGKITSITTGSIFAEVQLDIGGGNTIASTITFDSVERLGLKVGNSVAAVIKASDVMIARVDATRE
jgi:molybdate transport system regulatory protein